VSTIADKKPQVKVAHVLGVSRGRTPSNPAGLSVRRINPNKLRQFARARGVLAKNDRLDARLIAEYVAIMPTRVVQRDDAVERLAERATAV
jgi:hypothetical protein